MFTADIHRHQRVIDLPSGTVEVALDHGVLKSGDRSMPVSEIELELKDGSAGAIYELAERLAEHGPVRPSIRSKAARGFDLAADTPPPARKPQKLRLDPSIPLDDAFATTLRSCLHHLLNSLPAAEDGRNPEGIHQLRVSRKPSVCAPKKRTENSLALTKEMPEPCSEQVADRAALANPQAQANVMKIEQLRARRAAWPYKTASIEVGPADRKYAAGALGSTCLPPHALIND